MNVNGKQIAPAIFWGELFMRTGATLIVPPYFSVIMRMLFMP